MNRNGFEVMKRLLQLAKPLAGTMVLAVTMGVLGHLCAIFIPVLGGYAITGSNIKVICILVILYLVMI